MGQWYPTVHIVICGNLDDHEIVSVHASRDSAQHAAARHNRRFHGGAEVEEWQVQP
jgi:hypothetical protein